MKTCSTCEEEKEFSFFVKSKGHKDGYHGVCKPCRNEQRRKRGRPGETPEKVRQWNLKKYFGITPCDYDEILKSQQGRCAICRNLPTKKDKNVLHVDHDHKTGEIRGLLCSSCNVSLGNFKDDVELLKEAIRYLNPEVAGY
jgi:hypothetical protein|tara:strand:+ start:649 stop:1071 length:423 start_codon:yes stop_codon:yes gene_type:complete